MPLDALDIDAYVALKSWLNGLNDPFKVWSGSKPERIVVPALTVWKRYPLPKGHIAYDFELLERLFEEYTNGVPVVLFTIPPIAS